MAELNKDVFMLKGLVAYCHLDKPHAFAAKPGEAEKKATYQLTLLIKPDFQQSPDWRALWQACEPMLETKVGPQMMQQLRQYNFSPMFQQVIWPFTAKTLGVPGAFSPEQEAALAAAGVPQGTVMLTAKSESQPPMSRRLPDGKVAPTDATTFIEGSFVAMVVRPWAYGKQNQKNGIGLDLQLVNFESGGPILNLGRAKADMAIFGEVVQQPGSAAAMFGGPQPPAAFPQAAPQQFAPQPPAAFQQAAPQQFAPQPPAAFPQAAPQQFAPQPPAAFPQAAPQQFAPQPPAAFQQAAPQQFAPQQFAPGMYPQQ